MRLVNGIPVDGSGFKQAIPLVYTFPERLVVVGGCIGHCFAYDALLAAGQNKAEKEGGIHE
jgi:hypothetical protein